MSDRLVFSGKAIVATPVRRDAETNGIDDAVDAWYARSKTICQVCSGRGGLHDPACARAEVAA